VGNFYTNVTTIGPGHEEIVQFLRDARHTAFVSPSEGGVTVIYDQACDEQRVEDLHELAAKLTKHFGCCAASALVHDDDVLFFAAYSKGELITEYDSSVGREIEPRRLCQTFGVSIVRTPLVWLALTMPHLFFVFETARHGLLVRLLKLSQHAVGTGYTYIEKGEPPEDAKGESIALRHTRDGA
jgi:hypothetical protein